ncbi:MAG: maleylpyruvate isomerase family mycothiol-dependent enzyme [Actinomycetota bacterium]
MELAVTKQEIVQATRAERIRTLALLRGLEPAQWEIEALPRWRVREVAAHLITIDRASVTGAIFPKILASSSEKLERWNDRVVGSYADRPIPELLIALDRWGRRVVSVVRAAPAAALRVRVPTMWGKGPAGMFAWSRPFDEWVHRQDVRRALGMADETADLAVVAGFVLAAAGTSVIPQLAGRAGSITVDLSDVPLPPWTADLESGEAGLRQAGDAGSLVAPGPSATIRAPAPVFVMTTAGRGTFRELEDGGTLTVDGDRETADAFLSRLRVV